MRNNDAQIVVRLPRAILAWIDQAAREMTEREPGVRVTRAAVVRMVLLRGRAAGLIGSVPDPKTVA